MGTIFSVRAPYLELRPRRGWDDAFAPAVPEVLWPTDISEEAIPARSVTLPVAETDGVVRAELTSETSLLPLPPGVASSNAPPPFVRVAANTTCPPSLR